MRNEQLPVTVLSLSSPIANPMWRAGKILVRKREMRAGSTVLGAGGWCVCVCVREREKLGRERKRVC